MKQLQDTKAGQSTAVSELEAIAKRREEVINSVKAALALSLTEAANNITLLRQQGLQNVLGEPQFKEACEALGINVSGEQATPQPNGKAQRRSNRKGVSFEEAIQRALGDGKSRSVDEIFERVKNLKGRDVSRDTMLAVLSVVRKKGLIKNLARGQWQKA